MGYNQRKLKEAILQAPCVYCLAKPGEFCVTCTGTEKKSESHMQRVHAGHLILIGRGEHFCQEQDDDEGTRLFMKRSKGHVRSQWWKNKKRLT